MPITIRFIRDTDRLNDDVINISPLQTTVSTVNYTVQMHFAQAYTATSAPLMHMQILSAENLYKYINSLFTLVSHDTHPFVCVQIDGPNYPSVTLNPKTLVLNDVTGAINNMLDIITTSWPNLV